MVGVPTHASTVVIISTSIDTRVFCTKRETQIKKMTTYQWKASEEDKIWVFWQGKYSRYTGFGLMYSSMNINWNRFADCDEHYCDTLVLAILEHKRYKHSN